MRIMLTGGSEGIGGATLRQMAREAQARGDEIKIVTTASGRKPAPAELIAELEGFGAEVLFLTGDLGDAEVAREIAAKSLEFLGGLDVFVSNAGAGKPAPLAEQPLEEWDRMFNLNVRSTFVLAQAFYPALKESKGAIVVVASMSGMQAHLGQAAYAPAKAAVISLVENLAMEWAPDGIRVNAVAPGMIRTPLTAAIYEKEGLEEARSKRVPLGRVGKPEDIAAVIAFLASEGAGYVTGQTLLADGGVSATGLNNLPS
ncbi:SDR family NAD(P)-dependent oxidoreductase [Celeribacter litoreus]|uniref:SDR family NAD(P)-dependent oxidoreductase n=1 Tax=Celeribacter litoreus TaxID=2876714 RepID=UPI001CCABF32|nr:SDR family oxidoreductase [Celeribacter litoreus]MCA0044896.1 SDR family oxidoreductase [Celeribacter litoreus]